MTKEQDRPTDRECKSSSYRRMTLAELAEAARRLASETRGCVEGDPVPGLLEEFARRIEPIPGFTNYAPSREIELEVYELELRQLHPHGETCWQADVETRDPFRFQERSGAIADTPSNAVVRALWDLRERLGRAK